METIESFCDQHEACHDGKKWALENCSTMDDVWERAKPEWLIWVATRDGVLEDKTLRLFACFCARQIWPLLEDERSRNAVLVAEKFADGDATEDDLVAARDAALDAARDASWVAAWVAARDAARDAACATALDAARVAARDAARDAAWDAACATARVAARDAARDASWDAACATAFATARVAEWYAARDAVLINQAKWLRENAKPNFKLSGGVK